MSSPHRHYPSSQEASQSAYAGYGNIVHNVAIDASGNFSDNGGTETTTFVITEGGRYIFTSAKATAAAVTLGFTPNPGDYLEIRYDKDASGNMTVTTLSGDTWDGTNNTATFDTDLDALSVGYRAANRWAKILDVGAIAFSSV